MRVRPSSFCGGAAAAARRRPSRISASRDPRPARCRRLLFCFLLAALLRTAGCCCWQLLLLGLLLGAAPAWWLVAGAWAGGRGRGRSLATSSQALGDLARI